MALLITDPRPAVSLSGIHTRAKNIQFDLYHYLQYCMSQDIHRTNINTKNTDVCARTKILVG